MAFRGAPTRGGWVAGALAGLVLGAGAAHAQDGADSDDWEVIVSPYVWPVSLDGDMTLAGQRTPVDISISDSIEQADVVAMGDLEVALGRWGMLIDGQYVKTSRGETVRGVPVDLGVETTSAEVVVYYRIHERRLGGTTRLGKPRRFTIEPLAGFRWTRLEAGLSVLGQTARKKSEWTDPIAGIRMGYDLDERWKVSGETDFGVAGGDSFNTRVMLGYGSSLFGRPTEWQVGYRLLWQEHSAPDFTGGTFRWDVTRQGPVIGFSMHF